MSTMPEIRIDRTKALAEEPGPDGNGSLVQEITERLPGRV